MVKVVVVGAGFAGLSTALCVQERVTGSHVTVMADCVESDTTSHGAAGIFRPAFYNGMPGLPKETLRRWVQDGWDFYSSLAGSDEGPEAGVSLLPGYCYSDSDIMEQDPLYRHVVHSCRHVNPSEMKLVGGPPLRYGVALMTVIVEGRWHLPWLMTRFKKNGGQFIKQTVHSLDEFQGRFDVVVNCTGLRAGELVRDTTLIPCRGHILKVHAPWIRHSTFKEDTDTYVIPGREAVTVGGTRQFGRSDLEPKQSEREDIWRRACELVPGLKHGKIISEWVGLRPHRPLVRVERETLHCSGGPLQVVHNYGHGAHGVGLGWGCAKAAAALVQQALLNTSSKL